ncbi:MULTISPECIES: PaaI family thioesterase [Planococcus]|uniref:PaaI family thioesterase n=1 Tax=Planococcus wigleyi TaxID=2762216 RepID=A0ABR8W9V3_9BACL|nr:MULTISPECIES: PaaI family thioesterase [Planococcus]MBD8013747.1 PaaI family thioesterase [Planococcus wigleyi]MBF6634840.1 PaaI family thioesterase [Planococcus sp. (in: firmicutes)]MDN3437644.1 PaaI family thioesterase [Planococcus sp. APC 3900]
MNPITHQLERILENSSAEDLEILTDYLTNFEKKQQGEFATYLSASLDMTRITDDQASMVSIPNTPHIHNNVGIPHGGILAVLLDTAMGTLANSKCDPGFAAVTTTLTINYLTVADEKKISAQARVIRSGRHTMVLEGNIFQEDGKHIATATGSFFIIPKKEKPAIASQQ